MKYQATFKIGKNPAQSDASISIEKEGLQLAKTFVDYADVVRLRPINHRVFLDMADGSVIEISMLGFSYDGFWDELLKSYGARSLEALFIEEPLLMKCEGEYSLPAANGNAPEAGRGLIMLVPDAVCILPQTSQAVRIPLYYTEKLELDGYLLRLFLVTGEVYTVGRMGYDTIPFAKRCEVLRSLTKAERDAKIAAVPCKEPFSEKGIFRTNLKEIKAENVDSAANSKQKNVTANAGKQAAAGIFQALSKGSQANANSAADIFQALQKGLANESDEGDSKNEYWLAAFGDGCCAVELFTNEQTATYLYRFQSREQFFINLQMAMEAVGTHREIIFLPDEQLNEKPLYRMAVHRSPAVRFLRSCSAGRIIHSSGHAAKLAEFLGQPKPL